MDIYQQYIAKSRYSRYLDDQGRREHWPETVDRYCDYMVKHLYTRHGYKFEGSFLEEIRSAILNLEVMPSMRLMMTAGPAVERSEIAGFNCAYCVIDDVKSFDEIMYILLNGTGVGFSVERRYTDHLPEVPDLMFNSETTIVVKDSKEGWAKALRQLIALLYTGEIPKWDLSRVRPAGSRLKTFGGRASGPEPLDELFNFIVRVFKKAKGRKLHSVECMDIVCKTAEVVVVGGVRRCLTGDTSIKTPTGSVLMRDLQVGDSIFTGGKTAKVLAKVDSGVQPVVKLVYEGGELVLTPNHRLAVFDGLTDITFKEVSELDVEKDRLVFDRSTFVGEGNLSLPRHDYEGHFNAKPFVVPETIDTDLAWLFGLFHGDGHVNPKGLEISSNVDEEETLQRAKDLFFSKFGVDGVVGPDTHGGKGIRLRVNSVGLALWFGKYIKQPNENIVIPEFISKSCKEVRYAYLAGLLDADGRVRQDGTVELASTVYADYAKSLVLLVRDLGLACSLVSGSAAKRREAGVKAKDYYTLTLLGKTSRRDFFLSTDALSFKAAKAKKSLSLSGRDFTYPKHMGLGYRDRNTNYSTLVDRGVLTGSEHNVPVKILSIEPAGNQQTWDIEVEDIHIFTANGVVSHNSALICLTDLDDDKARRSKSGQWWVDNPQRRLANISAVYESCPDSEEFIREWLSLMESRSGERGIFSRSASRERCKATGRRDPNHEWGTNPCCVTGDTILHTTEGPKRIRDLEKTPFKAVVNGVAWDAPHGSWISGHAEVFQVSTSRGFSFKATAEHQVMTSNRSWVMVKDLTVDDKIVVSRTKEPLVWEGKGTFEEGLLLGAFIGDGNFIDSSKNHCGEIKVWKHDLSDRMKESLLACSSAAGGRSDRKGWVDRGSYYRMSISNLPKKYNIPRKPKQCSVELELTSSEFQKGFVTAYFDADGHVEGTQDSGYRVVVGSVHLQNLQILQRMLARQGILSRIYVTESGRPRSFCGIYDSKPLHRLFVSSESLGAFQKAFGFTHERKAALLNHAVSFTDFYSQKWETAFTSRVSCGIEEVWDAHVDGIHAFDANGLVLHNSEIVLRPNQMCNLSEVVCRPEDTPEDLLRKVRIATFLGTYQSTLTNFPYLRKQWIKNMEEERLLGVSLTGILDCATLVYRDETGTIQVSKDLLQTLRSSAVEANKQFAEELGIGQSMAVTCVKPSGTVSQLADCSSGLHGGHAPYYYRRVRSDSKDPITKFLLDAGFPGEPEVHNAGTTVFTFPKKAGPHTILRTELSALDHLRIWMDFQEHWCEHKPSVTISVKPKEWPLVAAYVYENFDHMTGVSFLPFFEENTTYKQLPYETVTEQRYLELLEQIPKEIDWEKFIEFDDNVEGVQNLACSGGFCEI